MSGSVARSIAISAGGGTKEMIKIPVESLFWNPKFEKRIELGDIAALALSIATDDFHPNEPILVRVHKDEGKFEVIDGRRRSRGAKEAKEKHGWKGMVYAVPVDPKIEDSELIFKTLTSNNDNRKPFEQSEEGEYFVMLKEEMKIPEKTIAEKIGKTVTYVRDRIALVKMKPDLKQEVDKFVEDGVLSPTAAASIAKISDKGKQTAAWEKVKTDHANAKASNPNAKIKGKDIAAASKGHSEHISLKTVKSNSEMCEKMFNETGHEKWEFGMKLCAAILNNKILA